jgi:hypothetical protein
VGMNLEHECYIGKNSEKKLYKVSAGMASTPRHGGVYSPTWSWPGLAALFFNLLHLFQNKCLSRISSSQQELNLTEHIEK